MKQEAIERKFGRRQNQRKWIIAIKCYVRTYGYLQGLYRLAQCFCAEY